MQLVDQDRVQVLQDRLAAARDADVPVAGGLAGLFERGLEPRVDEVEGGPARPGPGVTLLVRHDEDRVWNGAFSGHIRSPASNMRLPMTLAPVRSNVSRTMSLSRPSSPPSPSVRFSGKNRVREDPLLQFHPLLPHQLLAGLGRDEYSVQRHRHAEEHLAGHQSSTPVRTISVT